MRTPNPASAPIAGLLLVILLGLPLPARAVGLCDVAPLEAPNGVVELADALLILRAAVRLIDPEQLALPRADVAPVMLQSEDYVRAIGDGVIRSSDALVCLRRAVELIQFPPNLIVEIGDATPGRPPLGSTAMIEVRVENDGDSEEPKETTVELRVGAPFDPPAAHLVAPPRRCRRSARCAIGGGSFAGFRARIPGRSRTRLTRSVRAHTDVRPTGECHRKVRHGENRCERLPGGERRR